MVKLNEEIIGGLMSALARKESLEKAMMTFYNAGYEKEEIEDCAKDVYNKVGPKAMGVEGSLQEKLDDIATKAGVPKTEKPKEDISQGKEQVNLTDDKLNLQPIPNKKETLPQEQKTQETASQNAPLTYGVGNTSPQYRNDSDITNKIEEAIKGLRPVNIPSKIEIVHKNEESNPQVIQHVSSYIESPRAPSKTITYILVFILMLLLGALAAVFLFKDDLIKLFNNIGLG
jgi:hypothetical protein